MKGASQGDRYAADPPPRKVNGRRPAERAAATALKKAREGLGLSLEVLGERVERAASHLSGIETGRATPSPELLDRLAVALELDPAPLFCAYRLVPERAADTFFSVDRMRVALGTETIGEAAMRLDPALLGEIARIAQRLCTQDNRLTEAPIFIVEEQHRVYGFDPAYGRPIVWIDTANDSVEADPEEHARLEAEWDESGDEPDGWTRTAYQDDWRFVTACFTEAGCAEYIRINGHNHRGTLRIYAAGSYRNEEFRVVRRLLLALSGGTP